MCLLKNKRLKEKTKFCSITCTFNLHSLTRSNFRIGFLNNTNLPRSTLVMPVGKQAPVEAEQPHFQQAGTGHFHRKEKQYQTAIRA